MPENCASPGSSQAQPLTNWFFALSYGLKESSDLALMSKSVQLEDGSLFCAEEPLPAVDWGPISTGLDFVLKQIYTAPCHLIN
jgi:hypothetical protein